MWVHSYICKDMYVFFISSLKCRILILLRALCIWRMEDSGLMQFHQTALRIVNPFFSPQWGFRINIWRFQAADMLIERDGSQGRGSADASHMWTLPIQGNWPKPSLGLYVFQFESQINTCIQQAMFLGMARMRSFIGVEKLIPEISPWLF